jgi:prevent-host-death family protein
MEIPVKKKPMVRIVTATEAKNRFGEMIKHAYLQEEHLIVERGGIPVAAIIPIQDYEQLVVPSDLPQEVAEAMTAGTKAASARGRLRAFLAGAHRQMPRLPTTEVDRDIKEAVTAVRKKP